MAGTKITDISFDAVAELIAAEGDTDLIDRLDRLLGAALIITAAVSHSVVPLSLIGAKNEFTSIAKRVIAKLTGNGDRSFVGRHRRMAAAHVLLVYAAFFEAADELRSEVPEATDGSAKELVAAEGALRFSKLRRDEEREQALPAGALWLPHFAAQPAERRAQLQLLYNILSERVVEEWIRGGGYVGDRRREDVTAKLKELAVEQFEAGYTALCADFDEFFVWSAIYELRAVQEQVADVDTRIARQALLAEESTRRLDLGLAELGEQVSALPERMLGDEARKVIEGLRRTHADAVVRPIIEDRQPPDDEADALSYPSRERIFVPQSFRVTRYERVAQLEHDGLWAALPVRDDLGAFVLSYLDSPYSIESPLVLLGQPGSGKSLLTQILAARLATGEYSPIRIKLRDVDAERSIQGLVEDQVLEDTGRQVGWPDLSEQMDAPPLIMLDGFDELLQASGRVHARFLERVAEFQERELRHGRPARILVTSRVTLVDKGNVPLGSTVMRLEALDDRRRRRWVGVWNAANTRYFDASRVRPFELPARTDLAELASQPLLLMLLAVFDSEGNALGRNDTIDRTRLYDRLLRRFLTRELRKGRAADEFDAMTAQEQQTAIDDDMRRLGAAALGMFNRQALHISVKDLDADLAFLDLEPRPIDGPGRPLSSSERLFGSFFFVHESRAQSDGLERDSTFEFLHNTFGEFLAADFVLEQVIEAVGQQIAMSESVYLKRAARPHDLAHVARALLTALTYTPLYTRPVIVEMLRESCAHRLDERGIELEKFGAVLQTIVDEHVRQILDGAASFPASQEDPAVVRGGLLSRCAVYSLNLVILTAVLRPGGFAISGDQPATTEAAQHWDRLSHLWRAWLSIDPLSGFAAIVETTRDGGIVSVKAKPRFVQKSSGVGRLETISAAARGVGDDLLGGLATMQLLEVPPRGQIDAATRALDRELVDVSLELLLAQLDVGGWAAVDPKDERLRSHILQATLLERVSLAHLRLLRWLRDIDVPGAVVLHATVAAPHIEPIAQLPPEYLRTFCRCCAGLYSVWGSDFVTRVLTPQRVHDHVELYRDVVLEALRLADGSGLLPAPRKVVQEALRVAGANADLALLVCTSSVGSAVGAFDQVDFGIELMMRLPPSECATLEAEDLRRLVGLAERRQTAEFCKWIEDGLDAAKGMPLDLALRRRPRSDFPYLSQRGINFGLAGARPHENSIALLKFFLATGPASPSREQLDEAVSRFRESIMIEPHVIDRLPISSIPDLRGFAMLLPPDEAGRLIEELDRLTTR